MPPPCARPGSSFTGNLSPNRCRGTKTVLQPHPQALSQERGQGGGAWACQGALSRAFPSPTLWVLGASADTCSHMGLG